MEARTYYAPKSADSFWEPFRQAETQPSETQGQGAFRLLHRRLVARNRVFSVYLDHLQQRDGRVIEDYLSVVPIGASGDLVTGVAVLPERNGQLAMVRVQRHPLGRSLWEVPRGFIDSGETPAQAAARELCEETGLVVAAERLSSLGVVAPEPGLVAGRVRLFAALACTPGRANQQMELGHSEVRFFSPGEILEQICQGEIQDPCTLVAYFAFARSQGWWELAR